MSDWYRSGRSNDHGRHGPDIRDRRDLSERDRWRDPDPRRSEPRSFDDRRPDPNRGDYGGASYDAQDRAAPPYPSDRSRGLRYDQGAIGHNPALLRLAGGEADHPWRAEPDGGAHRGRGPKNYTRSDERIREDVNERLSDDPWLDASEIEVQVRSCEVTLAGTVQSRDDKRRTEDLVERVSGVKHVQNNLRVAPHPTQDPFAAPPKAGGSGPAA